MIEFLSLIVFVFVIMVLVNNDKLKKLKKEHENTKKLLLSKLNKLEERLYRIHPDDQAAQKYEPSDLFREKTFVVDSDVKKEAVSKTDDKAESKQDKLPVETRLKSSGPKPYSKLGKIVKAHGLSLFASIIGLLGLGFLAVYAAEALSPFIRFTLILAVGLALSIVSVVLARKKALMNMAVLLGALGSSAILLAMLGAGLIPGLQFLDSALELSIFVVAGVSVVVIRSIVSRWQIFSIFHVIMALCALLFIEQGFITLVAAFVIGLSGIIFTYRRNWLLHNALLLFSILLYFVYWRNSYTADQLSLLAALVCSLVVVLATLVKSYNLFSKSKKYMNFHIAIWFAVLMTVLTFFDLAILVGIVAIVLGCIGTVISVLKRKVERFEIGFFFGQILVFLGTFLLITEIKNYNLFYLILAVESQIFVWLAFLLIRKPVVKTVSIASLAVSHLIIASMIGSFLFVSQTFVIASAALAVGLLGITVMFSKEEKNFAYQIPFFLADIILILSSMEVLGVYSELRLLHFVFIFVIILAGMFFLEKLNPKSYIPVMAGHIVLQLLLNAMGTPRSVELPLFAAIYLIPVFIYLNRYTLSESYKNYTQAFFAVLACIPLIVVAHSTFFVFLYIAFLTLVITSKRLGRFFQLIIFIATFISFSQLDLPKNLVYIFFLPGLMSVVMGHFDSQSDTNVLFENVLFILFSICGFLSLRYMLYIPAVLLITALMLFYLKKKYDHTFLYLLGTGAFIVLQFEYFGFRQISDLMISAGLIIVQLIYVIFNQFSIKSRRWYTTCVVPVYAASFAYLYHILSSDFVTPLLFLFALLASVQVLIRYDDHMRKFSLLLLGISSVRLIAWDSMNQDLLVRGIVFLLCGLLMFAVNGLHLSKKTKELKKNA